MPPSTLFSRYALPDWFGRGAYIWDWGTVLIFFAASAVPIRLVQPVHRIAFAGDLSLSYPNTPGTVSAEVLYCSVFLGPLVVFTIAQMSSGSLKDLHHGCLSVAEALSLAFNVKRWLNLVGRHRPDWFARVAAGDAGTGAMSFPSGHAAYSFAAATVMSLYILGKFRVFSRPAAGSFPKAVAALLPVAGAGFIAASRLVDYRHDFSDVNAGSFIGICCGAFCYFLNFPSLFADDCHLPRSRSPPASPASTGTPQSAGDASDETDVVSHIGPSDGLQPPKARVPQHGEGAAL
uniref:Pa-phosphatase related-family protein n=1 Tax=Tetraselmis sp. GSL018 TaxID=582737 RepID=A0A061RWD4_9CHLO